MARGGVEPRSRWWCRSWPILWRGRFGLSLRLNLLGFVVGIKQRAWAYGRSWDLHLGLVGLQLCAVDYQGER